MTVELQDTLAAKLPLLDYKHARKLGWPQLLGQEVTRLAPSITT